MTNSREVQATATATAATSNVTSRHSVEQNIHEHDDDNYTKIFGSYE